MRNHCLEYFKEIYKDDNRDHNLDLKLPEYLPKVINEDNASLTRLPSEEEIHKATFSIDWRKAPGPDGYNANFFNPSGQQSRFKNDVVNLERCFLERDLGEQTNRTTIVLFPKREDAKSLKDYKPISLCNVWYKIIVKILVNRIGPLLHKFISPNQGAYIPGRRASGNIIVST